MRLAWPAIAFAVATLVALLLRALMLSALRRWANGWSSLPQAIRLPSILWSFVFGIWTGNEVARQLLEHQLRAAVVQGEDRDESAPQH